MNRLRLCMGSSCFARGNGRVVEVIKSFIKTHGLEASVELSGALCEGRCGEGPLLFVNETPHTRVSPTVVEDILRHALLPQGTGAESPKTRKAGQGVVVAPGPGDGHQSRNVEEDNDRNDSGHKQNG